MHERVTPDFQDFGEEIYKTLDYLNSGYSLKQLDKAKWYSTEDSLRTEIDLELL